jgi:hypothetical protein
MKDKFSNAELTALRNDLLEDGLIDSRAAAELLLLFLTGRGYGASPDAARDAVGRVEMSGCSIPVLQSEMEGLALVISSDRYKLEICVGPQKLVVSPQGDEHE